MKIIKKITAMMLSIMMVLGMCSVVSAAGTGEGEKGTITIDNAIVGQTYKIYKILDLVSYAPKKDTSGNDTGLYSYKPAKGWENFFDEEQPGYAYATVNKDGYVEWKGEQTEARAAELAQKALAYATKEGSTIEAKETKIAKATTVTFENLDLGYYLVDSSLGALCGLTTTNPTVKITEKNGEPTVNKTVSSDKNGTYGESNFANIGDQVFFKTVITAQAGAQNYVLHDTMSNAFTFNNDIEVKLNNETGASIESSNYTITYTNDDKCTFEIKFTENFCNSLKKDDRIYVTYSASLNGNAFIGMNNNTRTENINTTNISYGEGGKSAPSETETYTLQIPVFKYTGAEKKALAGAKFALYEVETNGTPIKLVQKEDTQDYRRALSTETGITEVVTTNTGKFNIQGLKPGSYWLEETAAPKGYNKLAKRIKITLTEYGNFTMDGNTRYVTTAEVENKSGSLLPSTGGMGTTIFYIAGAFLVLISGVVLIAKKRTDSK